MWVYDSGIEVGKKPLPPITVGGQKRDHSDDEEPARKMPAPEQNPYRTRYTDSMGRISVTYLAVDPQYKERYAMDKYFNKVYYFQDHRKHYNDPLNHRPTQIGYIEGPGLPESGERMDYIKAVDGSTQKDFDIQAGDTVYGGNFIYLLKPDNQLVLMTDAIMEMENAKKRKEQAERQAWVNSLTPTTYKGKRYIMNPFDKTSGNYNLWDDTIEEGVLHVLESMKQKVKLILYLRKISYTTLLFFTGVLIQIVMQVHQKKKNKRKIRMIKMTTMTMMTMMHMMIYREIHLDKHQRVWNHDGRVQVT